MLINATQQEELRVALVDGQKLYDLDIESSVREQKKANIYKGKITRIEPSLEAAFVDFGGERHGFLPLKEVSRENFIAQPSSGSRPHIKDALKEGQQLIVQVEREERGNKGAALTTFISLAGRYLVLMPNNPRAGGISRRIEGEERTELRNTLNQMDLPEDMGVIVRTAGLGRNTQELQWDLNYLLKVWAAIQKASNSQQNPFLIYQESDLITRAMRDYLRQDIGEVLIDTHKAHTQASDLIQQVMPQYQSRIRLYQDHEPLFNRFQIESQIEAAFEREVKLPSGGSIVIDPTEALVSIDINSARATHGTDIEETALNTNLEAAEEIARQLRLRDIGGLIVIDFIDMNNPRNQRTIESKVKDALQMDRARVQIGRISRFGLLEMSRQRLRPSLEETSGIVCPRCKGQGSIRDVKSLSLSILRLIEEEALKDKTSEIRAQVPVPVGTFLLNEKRNVIDRTERNHNVRVVVIPNPNIETPHYEVQRLRSDHMSVAQQEDSFDIHNDLQSSVVDSFSNGHSPNREAAAVQYVKPSQPAPKATRPSSLKGLVKSIIHLFSNDEQTSQQSKSSSNGSYQASKDTRSYQDRRNESSRNTQHKNHSNQKDNRSNKNREQSNQRRKESSKRDSASNKSRQIKNESSAQERSEDMRRRPRNMNSRRRSNRPSQRDNVPYPSDSDSNPTTATEVPTNTASKVENASNTHSEKKNTQATANLKDSAAHSAHTSKEVNNDHSLKNTKARASTHDTHANHYVKSNHQDTLNQNIEQSEPDVLTTPNKASNTNETFNNAKNTLSENTSDIKDISTTVSNPIEQIFNKPSEPNKTQGNSKPNQAPKLSETLNSIIQKPTLDPAASATTELTPTTHNSELSSQKPSTELNQQASMINVQATDTDTSNTSAETLQKVAAEKPVKRRKRAHNDPRLQRKAYHTSTENEKNTSAVEKFDTKQLSNNADAN